MSTLIVGCGYLGRRVAGLLLERGETVHGTARSEERARELSLLGVRPVIADVLDPATLDALPWVDRVLHCVGFDRGGGPDMRAVYVDGLRNLLDRLPASVRRIVHASSTSVYGQSGGEWIDEDSATDPAQESGRIVLEAERTLREWCERTAFTGRPVILRFSGLYGPNRVIRRALLERGEPVPGDPGRYLNLVHIDDAARAAVAALDAGDPDSLYLVSDDRPVERGEYYRLVARLVGAPEPTFTPASSPRSGQAGDEANRRVCNRRLREGLGLDLLFPDIRTGVPAALVASWGARKAPFV